MRLPRIMTTTCSTCTYCGEVVYGSPEDLADPLLDHWKEQCPSHPRRKEAMSRCSAVLKSYDSNHPCGQARGHDGPHWCEVCTTTWTETR